METEGRVETGNCLSVCLIVFVSRDCVGELVYEGGGYVDGDYDCGYVDCDYDACQYCEYLITSLLFEFEYLLFLCAYFQNFVFLSYWKYGMFVQ